MTAPADGFRILVVCTANICRSPLVAQLLARRLTERLGTGATRVQVSSAGVRALAGHGMDPSMARLLQGYGGTSEGFRSRQLDERLARGADLVLTATRDHRAAVVTLAPAALRRTFTIREMARLAGLIDVSSLPRDPVERLRALVAAVWPLRGTSVPPHPGGDDVADPHGGPSHAYSTAAEEMARAVDDIAAAMWLPTRPVVSAPHG